MLDIVTSTIIAIAGFSLGMWGRPDHHALGDQPRQQVKESKS
jgi:hypothetical protein